MATKIIDVGLASIQNAGNINVSPQGIIVASICRAQDDEQIFRTESLYGPRQSGQPMHPSGATFIPPGQSLTYNVTRRLTVSHFEVETEGQLNEALIFHADLKQRIVVAGTLHPEEPYQGIFNFMVRFEDIVDGFSTFLCNYNASITGSEEHKIDVTYTVNLVSEQREALPGKGY